MIFSVVVFLLSFVIRYYPVLIGYSHVYTRVSYTSSLYLNFSNYFSYARTEGGCDLSVTSNAVPLLGM
jgi:hypothetical protein